jgi:glutamate-5-semialdehyde dehydrogenase
MTTNLEMLGARARAAARKLARASTAQKNAALEALAAALTDPARTTALLEANALDVEAGRAAGLSPSLLDRMLLDEKRLASIAADTRTVARLPDPVGEQFDHALLPNGLRVHRRRVPLGVVGVIYEARPNVTVDCAALCLKSGNAAILRAGKEITRSSAALAQLIQGALGEAGLPGEAIQAVDNPDRALVEQLLRLDRFVDVIIPRGGAALHQFCREKATIPVITGGIGVCHVFVDKAADMAKVVPIVHNAKVQRPSVCNALDTVLLHRDIAPTALLPVARDLLAAGVELRLDEECLQMVSAAELQALFSQSGVRLVLLSGCDTARPADDSPASVAAALLAAQVAAVVAMQFPVSGEATRAFTAELFETLALGWPLDACVSEGRKAVQSIAPGRVDWAIPVLYTRAVDGVLFE